MNASSFPGAAPPPDGVTPNIANPPDVLHTVNIAVMITAIALITPFVVLRMYIRAVVVRSFGREEWTCLIAFITFAGYWICGMLMNYFGSGYHLWDLSRQSFSGFQKSSYVGSILYSLTSYFTKTSLLLLFVRVFAQFRKTVIFIWVCMAIMLAFCIAITIVKIRLCSPIPAIWDPSIPSTCLNRRASFIADTTMSAISDLIILIPPIPLTFNLSFSISKKIRIMGLLGAGGLATATSFVRLGLLVQPGSFDDLTVSFVRFNLLGVSEVGMGLICASLPALNILVTRHVTPDKPNERRYMFSEILRHPRGMNHVLGLSAESEKSTVAEERRGDNEREVEASDVGLESVITEYRWIGPYVSRAERLESDASTLRENVNS